MQVYVLSALPADLLPQIEGRLTEAEKQRLLRQRARSLARGDKAPIGLRVPVPAEKPAPPPRITGDPLPEKARRVLLEILKNAGEKSARVSSVSRTPEEQARIMYEEIVNAEAAGVTPTAYKPPGARVQLVFYQNRNKPKQEVIRLMTQQIYLEGPINVSKHLDPSVLAFDVAPSSIKDHGAFKAAVEGHPEVINFLFPSPDPKKHDSAFHIEILP